MAKLWRIVAKLRKQKGDIIGYRYAARTAAMIEGRPWKIDRLC